MSQDSDPPNIDSLLKSSNWEERVAQARVKREQVLAAKARAKATTQDTPAQIETPQAQTTQTAPAVDPDTSEPVQTFLRRNSPPPKRKSRKVIALGIIASLAMAVVIAALPLWA